MCTSGPDLATILSEWWGGPQGCSWGWGDGGCGSGLGWSASILAASNLPAPGGNPPYQISDFLAFYPQFGTWTQAILSAVIANGGTGYTVGDVLTIVQPDASGGTVVVSTVDDPLTGVITGLEDVAAAGVGTGYSAANGLAVTGGTGTGATINVTGIVPYPSTNPVPQVVVQAYINLATAALAKNRKWEDTWLLAMGWYVAHYLTLYLASAAAPGSTAQQIAAAGLEKGIAVSESAGDVSYSNQILADLEGFGSWRETTFGTILATHAKIVGWGGMYIR
jgi:hypothetical protein